jgi:hypothetical protein
MMNIRNFVALVGLAALLPASAVAQQVLVQSNKWSLHWTNTANPLNLAGPGGGASKPYVLHNAAWPAASRYRVWYDHGTTNSGLAYSFSADGLNWSAGVALTGLNTAANSVNGSNFAGSAVMLFEPTWAHPFRLYYASQTATAEQQDIWVAESTDGIAFVNNQVALSAALAGGSMDAFPEGHAVLHLPGRNVLSATAPTPEGTVPFLMYLRGVNYSPLVASSVDGYTFAPDAQPFLNVIDTNQTSLAGGFDVHPVQVLKVGQNDLRMLVSDAARTTVRYLVSSDAYKWFVYEEPETSFATTGSAGSWNEVHNSYATMAYVGGGTFYTIRGGQSATGVFRAGAALGHSKFYKNNDLGKWAVYSPFDNWEAEGWAAHTTAGGSPTGNGNTIRDGVNVDVIQNAGMVTIRDFRAAGNGNFNIVRDAELSVPFTFEYRAKFNSGGTTATGKDALSKFGVYPCLVDELEAGAESWQPAISATRIGNWNLTEEGNPPDSVADMDGTQFRTYTVVCRLDEPSRGTFPSAYSSAVNPWLCVFEVYTNRNFTAPVVTFRSVGFFGWSAPGTTPQLQVNKTDSDGQFTIGIPGPSNGEFTIDYLRWGNGVILDPVPPGESLKVEVTKTASTVQVSWPGGALHSFTNTYNSNLWVTDYHPGTLQSSTNLSSGWSDEIGATNGASFGLTNAQTFFRLKR